MEHLQTKQTLAAIDEKVNRLDQTLKMVFPSSPPHGARENRRDAKDLHVRKRKSVTTSLQSLEKRLKVLEMRAVRANKSLPRDYLQTWRGRDGRDGRDGPVGPAGPPGAPGIPGTPGRDGRDGRRGSTDHKVFLDQKVMLAQVERQVLEGLLDPKNKRDKKDRGCLE